MENDSENPFDIFIGHVEKHSDMWNSLEMKIVAKREKDNVYNVLGMRATISLNGTPMSEILLNMTEIVMLHEIISITATELKEIIKNLENGKIEIGEKELKFDYFERFDIGHGSGYRRGYADVDWDWPYFGLNATGNTEINKVIDEDEVDVELNKWGYENLRNASEENLGFTFGGATGPSLKIIAPIYLIWDAQIKENQFVISLRCHKSICLEDILITYGSEGNAPTRGRICFADNDILSPSNEFYKLQKIIELPGDAKSVRFWIYYKEEDKPISEYWVHRTIEIEEINPRWVVIDSLFSKRKRGEVIGGKMIFERNLGLLETDVPSGEAFEVAILNLMSVAGYEVIFVGTGFAAQGIDILTFSPESSDVIVISCTISNDIREKIRTLLPQIEKLKNELQNYELVPAIFSPIEDAVVLSSDNNDANNHKIALILSQDIKKIYEMIQTTPVDEINQYVLDYIKNKIPSW